MWVTKKCFPRRVFLAAFAATGILYLLHNNASVRRHSRIEPRDDEEAKKTSVRPVSLEPPFPHSPRPRRRFPVPTLPTTVVQRNWTSGHPGNLSIVCHTIHCGRLGNTLFEYASVLGIAWTTRKLAFFTNPERLHGLLQQPPPLPAARPRFHAEMSARCAKAEHISEAEGGTYDRKLTSLKPGKDYRVDRCLQSWKYFGGMMDEVREAVTFSDAIVSNATRAVKDLRRRYPNSTLVGIHVRRGDVSKSSAYYDKEGWVLATPGYFNRSMTHFRRKFDGRVTFATACQDRAWCAENLVAVDGDVVFLDGGSAEVDMQTLSLMDHVIQSLGSFSWWSAFKMQSESSTSVFFQNCTRKGSALEKWFSVEDYMLPEWLPM